MIARMIGGAIPLIRAGRERHVVETTWWADITWLRTRLRIEVTR